MIALMCFCVGLSTGFAMFIFCILGGVQSTAYSFLFMTLVATGILSSVCTAVSVIAFQCTTN
jgi:hypothetical protein